MNRPPSPAMEALWNQLQAGLVAGLSRIGAARRLTATDRQRIVDRARLAFDSLTERSELADLLSDTEPAEREREWMGAVLEELMGQVVALSVEVVLLEKRLKGDSLENL